jgi:hypothetical protein
MSYPLRLASTLFAAALTACASHAPAPAAPVMPAARDPASGGELIAQMHARYAGRWFSTLSFVDSNTFYTTAGGEQKTQWLEHVSVPGLLRIDYLPLANHSGVLYQRGQVHAFDNGRATRSEPGFNPLAVLAFDVYVQPVDSTLGQLGAVGFDVAALRAGTWHGRRAWVIGAAAGDTTRNQFWIDADSLLVRRVIQRTAAGVVNETRFDRYTDVGGYPIAIELLFLRNGRPYFKQEYASIRVDDPLSPALFDPAKWVESQPAIRSLGARR